MRYKIEKFFEYINWNIFIQYCNENFWNNSVPNNKIIDILHTINQNEKEIYDFWRKNISYSLGEVLNYLKITPSIGGNWLYMDEIEYLIKIQGVKVEDAVIVKVTNGSKKEYQSISEMNTEDILESLLNKKKLFNDFYLDVFKIELLKRNVDFEDSELDTQINNLITKT